MASKISSVAIFFIINVLFLALVVSACDTDSSHTKSKPKPQTKPTPTPSPTPSSGSSAGKCPKDTLKLGVCANVLNGLLNINLGKPPKEPCCSLVAGLVDLEAAVCLCTAIKAGVLGLHLDVPLSLSLLLNYCGYGVPSGFQCA